LVAIYLPCQGAFAIFLSANRAQGVAVKAFFFSVSALLILAACSSKGFNRGELSEQIGLQAPVTKEAEIKEVLEQKPNLPKPFRLGIYFKPQPYGKKLADSQDWRWTEADKELLESVLKDLKAQGTVSEAFPILDSLVDADSRYLARGSDVKAIRVAAAKQGADAVLIVTGVAAQDRYLNKMGWSYILVAPALFVPGSEVDTLFMANAALYDVRNEYLYLAAEAESTVHHRYIPAFGASDKELIEQVKGPTLAKLKLNLVDMIKGVRK
jgi:hypothetical protein